VARGISEISFENLRVSLEICGLQGDIEQDLGPFYKVVWISGFIFQWKIWWTGSTVDQGGADKRARLCLAGMWHAGARARWCRSVMAEEDEPDEPVSEGCSPEHEQRWRGRASAKKTGGKSSSSGEWRRARKAWKRGGGGVRMTEGGSALL
jgi:hypothetical protein